MTTTESGSEDGACGTGCPAMRSVPPKPAPYAEWIGITGVVRGEMTKAKWSPVRKFQCCICGRFIGPKGRIDVFLDPYTDSYEEGYSYCERCLISAPVNAATKTEINHEGLK
jgi:hypothetical protein